VDPRKFLFPILALDADGKPEYLRGNAFPLTPDGGLLTCRHVISASDGIRLAVLDREHDLLKPIRLVAVPDDETLDLAFLPGALERESKQFPLLSAGALHVGNDVFTYGFYSPSGRWENTADGAFKGHTVAFRTKPHVIATLSYPVIEGLSGSPVMKYHNGLKVVGVCFGSESLRILADEIVEVREDGREYRETVNRIVEFGRAYRSEVIEGFLADEVPDAELAVTSGPFDQDELGEELAVRITSLRRASPPVTTTRLA
jgi:hypothetical protein